VLHPDLRLMGEPDQALCGPLRQSTIATSHHPNHTAQTRALHAYLRWRNANARHRDALAAERKERARIRSEKGIRWGGALAEWSPDQPLTITRGPLRRSSRTGRTHMWPHHSDRPCLQDGGSHARPIFDGVEAAALVVDEGVDDGD
jgi:hypothetical protein